MGLLNLVMMVLLFPPSNSEKNGSRILWPCSPLPFPTLNSDLILKDYKCVRTITSCHPLKGKKYHTVLINTNFCNPVEVFKLLSGVRNKDFAKKREVEAYL